MTILLWAVLCVVVLRLLSRPRPRRRRRSRYSERYTAYIRSAAWRAKREEAFQWHGRACQDCGSQRRIEVHHLHYRTLERERMKDLRVLCHGCHVQADVKRRKARWIAR